MVVMATVGGSVVAMATVGGGVKKSGRNWIGSI